MEAAMPYKKKNKEAFRVSGNCSEGWWIQRDSKNKACVHCGSSWINKKACRNHLYRTVMKITSQAKDTIRWVTIIWYTKFIPMPQAMKIPDAKAAVDKEWKKKLETNPASQLDKVNSKKEVSLEAQRDKKKVHFGALMDICHLENVELEPQFQKYKGRFVLRGDIVKNDSGAVPVFTEQGSSASQMTAKKKECHYKSTRLWWTSSRRRVCTHSGKDGRCSQIAQNSKVSMSRFMDTSSTTQMAKILVKHWRSSGSCWTRLKRTSICWSHVGETVWGSFNGT